MTEGLDALVAAAFSRADQGAVQKLMRALQGSADGKENSGPGGKAARAAALQCFKQAQAKLGAGSGTPYMVLASAALAALEAGPVGSAAAAQLLPVRYNFVKRLVAVRAYDAAWHEALVLQDQLSSRGGGGGAQPSAEVASVAVGTALMLLLCCLEGGQMAAAQLQTALQAARELGGWLRVLPPADAEKHRDALFKYFYKAAAQLVERKDWAQVAAVGGAMAALAASDAHQQRALQAVLKFAAHMPDAAAASAAAGALEALLGGSSSGVRLADGPAQEAVGLLSTACQRAGTEPAAAEYLWGAVQQCCSSESAVAAEAALLLPVLVAQQGGSSRDSWVQPVEQAMQTANASAAALQRHLDSPSHLPPAEVRHHACLLAAAFQPCNQLRRALAGDPSPARLGGSEGAAAAAAAQLELLALIVSTAAHVVGTGQDAGQQLAPLARQGHAAAVALVTAAKLRAAAGERLAEPVLSPGAAEALLGWDFGAYCASGGALPSGGLLSGQELSWFAAALYNVGVDLYRDGEYQAAASLLRASASASICCLVEAVAGGDQAAAEQRAQDVGRRCSALSDAQLKGGDVAAAAAGTLSHGVAAMMQCGLGPAAWQDLLASLARLRLNMLRAEGAPPAPPAPAPVGSSRGSRGSRAPAAKGAKPASSATVGSHAAPPAPPSCSHLLGSIHAEGIPLAARAAVGEQELAVWAALASSSSSGGGDGAAAAECAQLASFLTEQAFPAKSCPVEHARILLAAYQAGAGAVGRSDAQLLAHAAAVLEGSKQGGSGAAALAGRARGLQALAAAQELVESSALAQRQQSHAAASTSSPASAAAAAAVAAAEGAGLPTDLKLGAWASVVATAEAALRHMEAATAAGGGEEQLQGHDWAALCQLAAELGFMAALQGLEGTAVRCQQLCVRALAAAESCPGRRLAQWAAITPDGNWLYSCLGPVLRPAVAQHVPGLEHCLEAWPGSLAALNNATSSGATPDLLGRLAELAAGPRHAGSVLQQACLHRLAAEQEAGRGSLISALFHATEAHRLLFNAAPAALAAQQPPAAGAPAAGSTCPVGWWQLAQEQLCSLMQLGRLFELSGMADEALHALKEGLRMAASMGLAPLAAAFRLQLADVYCKQGGPAAQQALRCVGELLEAAASSSEAALVRQLRAQQLVVEARLAAAAGDLAVSLEKSQAALGLCSEAAAEGGSSNSPDDPWLGNEAAAVQAAALLAAAECHAAQGGHAAAAELARAAAAAAGDGAGEGPPASSSCLQHRISALLLLVLHEPAGSAGCSTQQQEGPCLWGMQHAGAPSQAVHAQPAPAKKATGRGARSKVAAKEPAEVPAAGGPDGGQLRAQRLWRAYWLSREVPHLNRLAAAHLAAECGRDGRPHLAALLLHSSLGATMRQQYRLVLHTKLQQLRQRAGTAGADAAGCEEQRAGLEAVLAQLVDPLDGSLVQQLAGLGSPVEPAQQEKQEQPKRGRRAGAAAAAQQQQQLAGPSLALDTLEQQAEQALQSWVGVLPKGTVVCSVSSQPGCSFLSAGSGSTSGGHDRLVVLRLAAGAPPVIMQLPAPHDAVGGLRQHPIKALCLEPEEDRSGVHPLAGELLRLLEESGRSMRDMATDTRQQQREWWLARLTLDERLAALLASINRGWLGPWRCLLLGASADAAEHAAGAGRLVQQLEAHVQESGAPALLPQQLAILREALACLLAASGSLGAAAVQAACCQLCSSIGLSLLPEQVAAALAANGSSGQGAAATAEPSSRRQAGRRAAAGGDQPAEPSSSSSSAPTEAAAPARGSRARGSKTVTFQVAGEEPAVQEEGQQQQQPAKGRRGTTSRARRATAAAAPAEPEGSCSSPTAAAAGGDDGGANAPAGTSGGDLCNDFQALSLGQGEAGEGGAAGRASRALTTVRATKHRSRLKMMQASTPGPATSSKAPRELGATAAKRGAATAPRLRPAPTPAAAEPEAAAAASDSGVSGGEEGRGPVVLVLDGALQALPWESVPGLRHQRLYRVPSLPCAAASALRAAAATAVGVDLSSAYYALNPSGDLAATQSAFEDWFAALRWEGKAGEPPSPGELAAALQSRSLFVYFGHGGGEQYLPPGTLRALDRCASALLMGCSSGRLRPQQHYEPGGVVLAYLLAGCPAAVANLWDVTDKDIDRFSGALLSTWLGGGAAKPPTAADSEDGAGSSVCASSSGGGGSLYLTPAKVDVSAAVARSRATCKLPHLIGAAPVCYGLPTAVVSAGAGPAAWPGGG